MNPSDLHHLSGAYALDALDHDERAAFEAHYPSCEICSREVEQFQATAAELATAVEVDPSAELRARVLADVTRTRQVSPLVPDHTFDQLAARRRRRRPQRSPQQWLTAVAAALLVAVSITVWLSRDGAAGPDSEEVAVADILAAPDARVTALDAGEGTAGTLQVIWSPDLDQVALIGNGLAASGEGSIYELWLLLPDGTPAPAGLFEPDDAGLVRAVLPVTVDDADGFGVTIEPDGGSEQPTGSILYSGEA